MPTYNIVNSYELRVAAAPYWIIPGAVPSTLAQLLQAAAAYRWHFYQQSFTRTSINYGDQLLQFLQVSLSSVCTKLHEQFREMVQCKCLNFNVEEVLK